MAKANPSMWKVVKRETGDLCNWMVWNGKPNWFTNEEDARAAYDQLLVPGRMSAHDPLGTSKEGDH